MSHPVNEILMDMAREQQERELTPEEKEMAIRDHLSADERDSREEEREEQYAE